MRYAKIAFIPFLLILGAYLAAGCSEKSTSPKDGEPPPSTTMNHVWSKRFGDAGEQWASCIAVDTAGNVIVAGQFWSTIDFGGGVLASTGMEDIFIAKFDSAGNHLWSKRFGDAEHQYAFGIAVDESGSVIVTGEFMGTVDFGGGVLTSAGFYDIFIAKFSSDGSHLWSKRFGDDDLQFSRDVDVDASGNTFAAGYFSGTVDFGGGTLSSSVYTDVFSAKLDPGGAHLWSKDFGDTDYQYAAGVAIDASGNVIIVGRFAGSVNFGGTTLTSAGMYDVYVAKFDPNGTHLWSKRFGDLSSQTVMAVAVDALRNVIVAGYFSGAIDFGGGAITSAGNADVFAAKLDPGGAHLWSKRFGDASNQYATSVAVDASDNIIIGGHFGGSVNFGGKALTSEGDMDIFIAKLGSDGSHILSGCFGNENAQEISSIEVDAAGNMIITGQFYGAVNFGGSTLASAGERDVFIAKFAP